MRKFIEKYYSFIQWTKKWHFFHVFFLLLNIFVPEFIKYVFFTIIDANREEYWWGLVYTFILHIFLAFLISICFELFIVIIKIFARKKFYVQSKFLLNNQLYNIIYQFIFLVFVLAILELLAPLLWIVLLEALDYILKVVPFLAV